MKTCPTCREAFESGEVFCPNDGARLRGPSIEVETRDDDPLLGTVLQERYRILRRIGEGGMGFVYEAEHELIEKRVAVKVLRQDLSSRSDLVQRFRQEAKSASRIGHAHIVDISDFGWTSDGAAYFVMEMLQGEDLADLLARERNVKPTRAVDITIQCCKALGAAHAKSIIHRDMKPENIFLTATEDRRDFVKLVDFGIAKMTDFDGAAEGGRKLTKTGVLFGTPEYMAPEQAAGKGFDHRADLYALGVILYEMLTGKVPFEGDNFLHVLAKHSHDPVPRMRERKPSLDISPALEDAVMGALEKDPERRFQTMEAFAVALAESPEASEASRAAAPQLSTPQADSAAHTAGASRKPFTLSIAAAALGLTVALGVAAWVGFGSDASEGEATRSEGQEGASDAPASVASAKPAAPPASEAEPAQEVPPEPESAADEPPAADDTPETAAAAKEMVTIRVRTRPGGAHVHVEGRGQVCERTPCEIQVARGEEVALSARRGRGRATARFVAEAERDVALRLRAPSSRKSSGSARRTKKEPTSAGSGDLKIPEIFRQ